jgi:hypothetical protein
VAASNGLAQPTEMQCHESEPTRKKKNFRPPECRANFKEPAPARKEKNSPPTRDRRQADTASSRKLVKSCQILSECVALSAKTGQKLSKRHEGFLTLSDENGKQMTSPSVMLELLPRRMEAVGFWCLEPDVKASPNVDANPQLLRLHRSQYAR